MAKILVIDDEAELLEMMRLVLERREGHQVNLSADGEDGLAQALAEPPDLAIIDVMMPGITGYEVCRQLRANPTTASTAIIILTARAQPVDRDAALEAGADDYLAKPVMMNELLERVNTLLAGREAREEAVPTGVIALLSLRGGVGVTTLAVNLAATLAHSSLTPPQGESILVDFCASSGHVALQLGLRPQPNWSSIVQADDLNAEIVETTLLEHTSGLRVLASPIFPIVGQAMPRGLVQTTLKILKQRFAVVVVDTSSVLDEATVAILEEASRIGLVLTAEAPSIQTAIGTLRALKQWSDKLHVILNQVTPGPQPPTEAIARTLKRQPAVIIPFDQAQARALAQGKPLALHNPTSSLTQAVRDLAQALQVTGK